MFGRFKLLAFSFFLFLGFQSAVLAAPSDRLDSIGIQKVGDKIFILHQVVGQETLFSISRRYKVPMSEIQQANETLKQGIIDGQTLLVPYGQSSASTESVVSTAPVVATPDPAPTTVASTTVVESPTVTPTTTPTTVPVSTSSTEVKVEKPTTTSTMEPTPTTTSKPVTTTTIQKVRSTHKVKSGESLSTIAKKYKVTVAELKSWNSLTTDKVLVGQSLKMIIKKAVTVTQSDPEPKKEVIATKEEVKEEVKKDPPIVVERKVEEPKENKAVAISTTGNTTTSGEWISHTVKSGESLFSLSKQYGTSIEELIQWNALTSNNLKVDQSIKVARATAAVTPVPVIEEVKTESIPVVAAQPKQENTVTNTSGGFTNTKESGLAEVIPGSEASKKYLVLHRNAPIGSVIRVKNEENDLTIFARVVGVLPETGDNTKVLIKLSQAAFEQLKGVNSRFPVEILY